MESRRTFGFSQNQLKMVAAISMFIDHAGAELFPQLGILRIIGRLAFPIFSFFIYEGYRCTHSKIKYAGRIFALGLLCGVVYYLYAGIVFGNVLITFTASIAALHAISLLKEGLRARGKAMLWKPAAAAGILCGLYLFCVLLEVDYGFWGVLLPALALLGDEKGRNRSMPLASFAVGLLILSIQMGGNQFYSLLSLPLLALYSGSRGEKHMQAFFYWFYPAHLALIGAISMVAERLF